MIVYHPLHPGKGLDTTSGGTIKNRDIAIEYTSDWADYTYLKIFVRSGWGSQVRDFKITKLGNVSEMVIQSMTYGGVDYNVVFVPISDLGSSLLSTVRFSDL